MLALCLMLSGTYYAQNYASIIGGCLLMFFAKMPQNHIFTCSGCAYIDEISKFCQYKNYNVVLQ